MSRRVMFSPIMQDRLKTELNERLGHERYERTEDAEKILAMDTVPRLTQPHLELPDQCITQTE